MPNPNDNCEVCFHLHWHRQGIRADGVGISIASPGVITWPRHPLTNNSPIVLTSTGALLTGLTAGKLLFARPLDADTFNVAATRAGAAINTSGAQSGMHSADLVVVGCHEAAPKDVSLAADQAGGKARWREVDYDYWCGAFAVDYPSAIAAATNAALEQISAAAAQTALTTGDGKLTLKTTPDVGYVMMDDGTIGSATSGASNRANADCQALFTLLWNNIADADAPVVTGRGATAAADWAANKKITLTKQLGRDLAIAGAGAGLTARTLGHADGAETHALTPSEAPPLATDFAVTVSGTGTDTLFSFVTAYGAAAGTAHSIVGPRTYWNVMLKL